MKNNITRDYTLNAIGMGIYLDTINTLNNRKGITQENYRLSL